MLLRNALPLLLMCLTAASAMQLKADPQKVCKALSFSFFNQQPLPHSLLPLFSLFLWHFTEAPLRKILLSGVHWAAFVAFLHALVSVEITRPSPPSSFTSFILHLLSFSCPPSPSPRTPLVHRAAQPYIARGNGTIFDLSKINLDWS